MTIPDIPDFEITEQMVEGIYTESQYKIENIPGYAEKFKLMTDYMLKFMKGYKPTKREQEEYNCVTAELILFEIGYRIKKEKGEW